MTKITIHKDTLTYVTHWTLESFAYGPFKSIEDLQKDVTDYVKSATDYVHTVQVIYV